MAQFTKIIFFTFWITLSSFAQGMFQATLNGKQAIPSHVTGLFGGAEFTVSGNSIIGQAWVEFGLPNHMVQVFRSTSSDDLGVPLFTLPPLAGYYPTGDPSNPGGTGWIFDINRSISSGEYSDLQSGNWWINVSTPAYPSGEIRGQITAVPEPTSIGFLIFGIAGLGLSARWAGSHCGGIRRGGIRRGHMGFGGVTL